MVDSLSPPRGVVREAWLLRLSAARDLVGEAHFRQAPLIVGDEQCFPDRFTADAIGATRLLRRMLAHAARAVGDTTTAEFGEVQVEERIDGVDGSTKTSWRGARSRLYEADDGAAGLLVIEQSLVDLPDALLEELAFNVAWLTAVRGGHGDVDAHDVVATAVALGFGWLLLQGSWIVEQDRNMSRSSQRVSSAQRATPGEIAFLLACWARTRGVTTTKAIGAGLRDNQAAALKDAMREPPDPGFVGATTTTWPVITARIDISDLLVPPAEDPEEAAHDDLENDDDDDDQDEDDVPTFRVGERRFGGFVALGTLLAMASMVAVALFHVHVMPVPPLIAPVLFAALVIAGALLGHRNVVDVCSDPSCKHELPAFATRCDGCGRPLGQRIKNADERLRAEEQWRANRLAPPPMTSAAVSRS